MKLLMSTNGTKICSKCGKSKVILEFHKHKYSKDGHKSICKECAKATPRKRVQGIVYACLNCGKEYHPKSRERNKFCSRECAYEYKRVEYACAICGKKYKCGGGDKHRNLTRCRDHVGVDRFEVNELRYCAKCGEIFRAKRVTEYLCEECREGLSMSTHGYYKNRDELLWKARETYVCKERTCPRCGASFTGTRENRSRYCRECKPIIDLRNRVNNQMGYQIWAVLNGEKKGQSWQELVGYTADEFIEHIESQFLPGMTWQNRGDWHVDHIMPKSWFEYKSPNDTEFRQCWALSNLQPLWAEDNVKKSNKEVLTQEQIYG